MLRENPDNLARQLTQWALWAKKMPPSWDGACISQPIGTDVARFGRMLPGKGLLLDTDLKQLGITCKLPYVYERSLTLRLTDKWHRRKWTDKARQALAVNHIGYSSDFLDRLLSQRGALNTYSAVVTARSGAVGSPLDVSCFKSAVTTATNQWHSPFMNSGTPPAASITATNGAIMTSQTLGAFNSPWPAASNTTNRYLVTYGFGSGGQHYASLVHDILWAGGPYAVGSTGTTSITQPALTRYTSGSGVLITSEVTTLFGGTAATMQFDYTSVPGAASHNTGALPVRTTAAIVGMLQPSISGNASQNMPWAPFTTGDYGTTAITAIEMAGTAMSTGAVNVYLYYPLIWVPGILNNSYVERDSPGLIDGIIQLGQDASFFSGCLNVWLLPVSGTTGTLEFFLRSCVG